ncbi:MAG: protein TolQ [Rickettsiaceae bacterium]
MTVSTQSAYSVASLIFSADIVSKLVMIVLLIASIWSWAIIVAKLCRIFIIKKRIVQFESMFWSGKALDKLYVIVKNASINPLASVFLASMNEYKRIARLNDDVSDVFKIHNKDKLLHSMYITRDKEINDLDRNLGFLATTGSAAPFIGLLGTVWGIMHSFQSIAASKNTTLAVVAPGIAEALLATVIGLFAAIPAVIFYNYLNSEIDKIYSKIDDFIIELNKILSSIA